MQSQALHSLRKHFYTLHQVLIVFFFTGKKESIAHWHEIAQVHQTMMEKRWECKYGQESSYLRPAYYGPLSVMQEPSGGRRKPHQLGLSLRGVEKAAALRQCSP